MKSIKVNAYAKINLSLDVIARLPNGYHQVEMVMHQIGLHDEVLVRWFEDDTKDGVEIYLKTNKYYLPTDERNLAYKAAMIMAERFGKDKKGTLRIDILKCIPVAAGLAGGSSNGAAVLHGVNKIWNLKKSLKELCDIGAELGSDVPFTLMGQAKTNKILGEGMKNDPLATCCALATGTGTELKPLPPFKGYILLSKPSISVSTPEVYKGMKLDEIKLRPDNQEMIKGLEERDKDKVTKNVVNVLEQYTLTTYKKVAKTKELVKEACPNSTVVMSGSGPTIFAICPNEEEVEKGYARLKDINEETYKTRTML